MKISQLYGKDIKSNDGSTSGLVFGATLEGDRLGYLCCFDGEEREFFVDVNAIIKAGDCILFGEQTKGIKPNNLLRLGKACFSQEGKYLGTLKDCNLKNFAMISAKIGNKTYPFCRLCVGDVIIVKSPSPHELFINALCEERG